MLAIHIRTIKQDINIDAVGVFFYKAFWEWMPLRLFFTLKNLIMLDVEKWWGLVTSPMMHEVGLEMVGGAISEQDAEKYALGKLGHFLYGSYADWENNFTSWIDVIKTKEVSINAKGLTSFPKNLHCLPFLEDISFCYNNITKIPNSISRLLNLKNISLEGNKIRSMPSSIAELKKLSYLCLAENNILEKEFNKLDRLLPNTAIIREF